MSDTNNTKEPSDKQISAIIKAIREDFNGIVGFIAGEFVKIAAANDGIVDINNKDFYTAAESLINADPKIINSPETVKKRG
jgi:hypothetical protein